MTLKKLLLTSFAFALLAGLSACHVGRFFIWNFADIHDNKKFAEASIPKGANTFTFAENTNKSVVKLPKKVSIKKREYTFDELLHKTKTVAFLVIRNDTLLHQKYLNGYTESTIVPSFSVAKSFTSMLVGIAIGEGKIESVHDPVTKYLPELKKAGFEKVTIEHLLNMRSGIKSNESYFNPFAGIAKLYYGRNLKKYIRKLKTEKDPGGAFNYQSVNTQVLALIVERATHKSLPEYMEENIWKYIGAKYDAGWSIDSRKHQEAKAFCCFNARPIDFAKMGRLYLNNGNWNGKQLVPADWVEQSLKVENTKKGVSYTYQWWHTKPNDFFADGLLGQYIYVLPEKNIIIVRMGKKEGIPVWTRLLRSIAEQN